jgi:hypothetical protein
LSQGLKAQALVNMSSK